MKMSRKMHICEVNGSGYRATEKNQFLACYDVSKNGRHFEPEVEFIFNVSTSLMLLFRPFKTIL